MTLISRREALIAAASAIASSRLAHAASDPPARQPICVFTKPFNSLTFDELADRIAELGFDGIEAPIRQGGHIEPTDVEDRLPQLVDALHKRNLEITVLTSDINDADDLLTERVLRTAASLGIQRYRMKYLMYDLKRSVTEQIAEWRPRFRDLAALNHDVGIRGLYQNHAGERQLGAALWDLQQVLEGIPVDRIAVAYDIRHATVEGGMSWPVTFNMIRPHVDTVYVKDFRWTDNKPQNVPLGEGQVNPRFFRLLADSGFHCPISLHEEYLDHRKPELVPQHLAALRRDLQTLRGWLRDAGMVD